MNVDDPPIEDGLKSVVDAVSRYASPESQTRILLAVAALYNLPLTRQSDDGSGVDEEEAIE